MTDVMVGGTKKMTAGERREAKGKTIVWFLYPSMTVSLSRAQSKTLRASSWASEILSDTYLRFSNLLWTKRLMDQLRG